MGGLLFDVLKSFLIRNFFKRDFSQWLKQKKEVFSVHKSCNFKDDEWWGWSRRRPRNGGGDERQRAPEVLVGIQIAKGHFRSSTLN